MFSPLCKKARKQQLFFYQCIGVGYAKDEQKKCYVHGNGFLVLERHYHATLFEIHGLVAEPDSRH